MICNLFFKVFDKIVSTLAKLVDSDENLRILLELNKSISVFKLVSSLKLLICHISRLTFNVRSTLENLLSKKALNRHRVDISSPNLILIRHKIYLTVVAEFGQTVLSKSSLEVICFTLSILELVHQIDEVIFIFTLFWSGSQGVRIILDLLFNARFFLSLNNRWLFILVLRFVSNS